MTARYALRPTLAAWPIWSGLFLLVVLNLGCVNLKQPYALAHPDGSAAGSSGGTSTVTGSGGTWAGGAGGSSAVDAGQGGTTITSSSDSDIQGGSSAIDTASAGTGGSGSEGGTGAGGTAGKTGGSTGTASGAGAGGTATGGTGGKTGTAGSTGTGTGTGTGGAAGGTGGTAGTSAKGGSAGQTSVVPDAGLDAAPDTARDTRPPDAYCAICAIGTSLVHRYSFNGSGTTITDSVGTANGTVTGATLSGSGTLVLAGGTSNQYAQFPAHILNTLTSATLEIWVTWTGGNNNQRILDFGSSRTSGSTTSAVTTVIISPNSFIDNAARLRASYCSDTSVADSSKFTDATGPLATATASPQQVVAVFDGTAHTLTMYVNGVAQGTAATGLGALSLIDDVNNYLGKSQYSGDPGFAGTYHEFRIYNAALTGAQVQTVFTAGQNASFN